MLDPRIYRFALIPVLLALLVVAFSLDPRPRAIGTTVAVDAFDAKATLSILDSLVEKYPDRRPGSVGDQALAQDVAGRLRTALHLKETPGAAPAVRLQRFSGDTIDGKQDLVNVIATRPGAPGPGLVIVAHRDAARPGSEAELSGTASLLELADVAGDGSLRRTISFVSTSGGSGGAAGAKALAAALPGPVEAVIVLGDVGGVRVRKPFVTSFSNGRGLAPLQLRQTVAAALRTNVKTDPGGPRASTQWAREAFPLAPGEQGALLHAGIPAVLVSVSGERGPEPTDRVLKSRLEGFGKGVLGAIFALDNGPTLSGGVHEYVVTQRKVLPAWAIRLLGAALLGPVLLCALDGFARSRRKREPIGRALLWVLATAFPFAITAAMAVLFAAVGLIAVAPAAPLGANGVELDGAVTAAALALVLVMGLGWAGLRPLALRVAKAERAGGAESRSAAACAALVMISLAAIGVWLTSPLAAVLLVPAAHLWLLAITDEWPIPRVVRLLAVGLGFVPFVIVGLMDFGSLGYGARTGAWQAVLLVAGGTLGPATWLLWSVLLGCAVCVARLAYKATSPDSAKKPDVTVRGPRSYAGPGSLGGTQSALRK